MADYQRAVIFDLDGVLTDTAELHYRSWRAMADELGLPFDRKANEALRGVARERCVLLFLGDRADDFSAEQREEIARRKNELYQESIAGITPHDMLPGARELLEALRELRIGAAVASASKNASRVIDRLGCRDLLDAIIDGTQVAKSKPAPDVFLRAAEGVGVSPRRCVAVEDAASGVEAALTAGMRVIGIGPRQRVGDADLVIGAIGELQMSDLLGLFPSVRSESSNVRGG